MVRTSAKSTLMRPPTVMRSGDALHGAEQHFVGALERVEHRGRRLGGDRKEALIRNRDQRVDRAFQRGDAFLGLLAAARTFEQKWFGDDADGQAAELARDVGDDRRRARARQRRRPCRR